MTSVIIWFSVLVCGFCFLYHSARVWQLTQFAQELSTEYYAKDEPYVVSWKWLFFIVLFVLFGGKRRSFIQCVCVSHDHLFLHTTYPLFSVVFCFCFFIFCSLFCIQLPDGTILDDWPKVETKEEESGYLNWWSTSQPRPATSRMFVKLIDLVSTTWVFVEVSEPTSLTYDNNND